MKEIDFEQLDFLNTINEVAATNIANLIFSYNDYIRKNDIDCAQIYYNMILGMMYGISCYEEITDKNFRYINNIINIIDK